MSNVLIEFFSLSVEWCSSVVLSLFHVSQGRSVCMMWRRVYCST